MLKGCYVKKAECLIEVILEKEVRIGAYFMQKSEKGRTIGRMFVTALAAAALAAAFAVTSLADQDVDTSRFVPGTRVNGVGIGGLTTDEAKTRIEGFYDGEYTLTVRNRGGAEESIKGNGPRGASGHPGCPERIGPQFRSVRGQLPYHGYDGVL